LIKSSTVTPKAFASFNKVSIRGRVPPVFNLQDANVGQPGLPSQFPDAPAFLLAQSFDLVH
jgi:hypothetical protein